MSEDKKDNAQPSMTLTEVDRISLELVKSREQTARSQYEAAALNTRAFILQIYLKYGLNENDLIKEDGTIVKDGAVTQNK